MTRMTDPRRHVTAGTMSILMVLSVSAGLVAGTVRSAYAGSTGVLIAETTAAPEAAADPAQAKSPMAHVDARIEKLHKQLQITAEQEPQFKAFADVMRGNAQAMHALFQERGKKTDHTAVANLRWYAQLTAAHAEGLNKLVPAFDALYQSLSDKQKETADQVFDEFGARRRPHHAR